MKSNHLFLAHQIARFGAMSIQQMQFACTGKCHRATLYRMLNDLIKKRLVKRISHYGKSSFLYSPTTDLYELIYGDDLKRNTGLNGANLLHAEAVADALLNLSRYSFVTGIASEFEIHSSDVEAFCSNRTPDGIIQLTNDTGSFVLAVEVERTRRSNARINDVLNKYKKTFANKSMQCAGLIIVAGDNTLRDVYQTKIEKYHPELGKETLVVTMEELSTLKEKHFGEYQGGPGKCLENIAMWSNGAPTFSPIISTNRHFKNTSIDPYVDGQTATENETAKTDEMNTNDDDDQNENHMFSAHVLPQEVLKRVFADTD